MNKKETKKDTWQKNIGDDFNHASAPTSVKNEVKTRFFILLLFAAAGLVGLIIYFIASLFD